MGESDGGVSDRHVEVVPWEDETVDVFFQFSGLPELFRNGFPRLLVGLFFRLDTYVIQAGPEFKVLGKNSLGETALATPAVSRGSLIVRTASKLYRITAKK